MIKVCLDAPAPRKLHCLTKMSSGRLHATVAAPTSPGATAAHVPAVVVGATNTAAFQCEEKRAAMARLFAAKVQQYAAKGVHTAPQQSRVRHDAFALNGAKVLCGEAW